jgi:hypothetical protein
LDKKIIGLTNIKGSTTQEQMASSFWKIEGGGGGQWKKEGKGEMSIKDR